MIEIYSREDCTHCKVLKETLNSIGVSYREHLIDKDVTREHVKELFPEVTSLPIMVAGPKVYLGLEQCNEAVATFDSNLGKQLLSE
jgi:glutaredoxin